MRNHEPMSERQPEPRVRARRNRFGSQAMKLTIAAICVAITFGGIAIFRSADGGPADQVRRSGDGDVRWRVERGSLTISALASGELRTREMVELRNEIMSSRNMKITWIIPEGTKISKGDKLVEIDSSDLEDGYRQQKIKLADAELRAQEAKDDLAIAESQSRTDVVAVANRVEMAEIDLEKYIEGDFLQAKRRKESAIRIAQEELKRAQDRLEWTRRLADKEYVTQNDLEADEFALMKTEVELETAEEELKLLEKYTYKKETTSLNTALVEAKGNEEEVRLRWERDLNTRKANLSATAEKAAIELTQTDKLSEQLSACVIYAPTDGLVVYHKDNNRWGSSDSVLQVGTTVNPRQRLIDLPDFSSWMVEARVHESMIQKIKMGQSVFVTLESLPDDVFEATVSKIAVLPDSSVWFRDTSEYIVEANIKTSSPSFKPGMSGRAEIIIREIQDVPIVPVQAISFQGGKTVARVVSELGTTIREVKIGGSNDRFVEITEGLSAGEEVLLDSTFITGSGVGNRPSDMASGEQRDAASTQSEKAESAPRSAERGQRGSGGGRPEGRGERNGADAEKSGASEGGAAGAGRGGMDFSNMSDEQREQMRKRMEERMANMSPEERKTAEERIKQFRQNNPGAGGS